MAMVPSSKGRSKRVTPASWATVMTAVRVAVAMSPNSAQPAQSTSGCRQLAGLGVERVENVSERFVEGGHALVFEGDAHVLHVDTDIGQPVEH